MRYILWATLLIWSIEANAQVAITPTSIEISPTSRINELNLTNIGNADRMFESTVKVWSQVGHEDHFVESNDVLILPKAVTIKPHAKQKLRVVLQNLAPEKTRNFYRIFITEVVSPKTVTVSGLRFLLNLSIPVFSNGLLFVEKAQAEWSITFDAAQDRYYLSLTNKGNAQLVVQNLAIVGHEKDRLTALQYVLPASSYRWPLPTELSTKKNIDISFNLASKDEKLSLVVPVKKLPRAHNKTLLELKFDSQANFKESK